MKREPPGMPGRSDVPVNKDKPTRRRRFLLGGLTAWLVAGLPLLLGCALLSGVSGGVLGAYMTFSKDLPKIPDLRAYRPKTVSTFYAEDGTVIGMFYKEKRFPVPLEFIPQHVINAFLAAEDARFFSHPGVDLVGIARAFMKNIQAGDFAQGGSTITQQVVRNFLLTREKKISRKVREAILAFRLESALTKQEILEIYLNEIYLGNSAYGVESAARTYFGKSCGNLTIAEAALIAGLVPAPSRYSPTRDLNQALERRAWVLESMRKHDMIGEEQYRASLKEKAVLRENLPNPYERAPYFAEAVRRYVVEKYGEDQLYHEGLQVWTTCDLSLQGKASEALRSGTVAWEKRQRRPKGLLKRLKPAEARDFLSRPRPKSFQVGDIVQAVVVKNHSPEKRRGKKKKDENDQFQHCTLALGEKLQFQMKLESKYRYRPNDLLEFRVVQAGENDTVLEHVGMAPVQGAVVCIENRTGYVRALVGGLDFERSRFNRAIQAKRQPGSAFKPFVYATALERGFYGPNTGIVDEPIAVIVDPREPEWVPMNSDREFRGFITLTDALVHSRNTATVKLLMDVGIEPTIETARKMGIESALGRNLSICLGASEVTPLELTSAYTVFPNLGTRVHPVLVKKVLDRFGRVLEDNTADPIEITRETLSDKQASAWQEERRAVPFPADPQQLSQDDLGQYFYQQYWRQHYPDDRSRGRPPQNFDPRSEDQILERDLPDRQPLNQVVAQQPEPEPGQAPLLNSDLESLLSLSKRFVFTGEVSRRPDPTRVLSPQTAYLMTSILRRTCISGTAAKASRLKRRDLAGKTGTTDDSTDAWFIGFNPTYTTGVWIGHDTKVSLGRKEYGNRAALPVWMEFMGEALSGQPNGVYPPPPGIVYWETGEQQQRGNLVALLESSPDLAQEFPTKRVSPLDSDFGPRVGYDSPMYGGYPGYVPMYGPQRRIDPYTGQPVPAVSGYGSPMATASFYDYHPGTIRVFAPNGETLGYAPYSVDEKGKVVVYREMLSPVAEPSFHFGEQEKRRSEGDENGFEQPRPSQHPLQSLVQGANRLFQDLRHALPHVNPFEWTR